MTILMSQVRKLGSFLGCLTVMLVATSAMWCGAEDVHFDVFHFGTDTLTNATVIGRSKTDVFVSHPQGLTNVKIRDLDAATLHKLGLGPKPESHQPAAPAATTELTVAAKSPVSNPADVAPAVSAASELTQPHFQPSFKLPLLLLSAIAVAGLVIYLFFSYCTKLIVQKSGVEPSVLVWVPVLQLFPLMEAAKMSGWWVLAYCIPGLNLVAQVIWAINIVKVRQKSIVVLIALILPVSNLVAFVYLAFSSAEKGGTQAAPTKPVTVPAVPTVPQRA